MTVLGLPAESWVLVVASVGIGLVVELAFFRAHRRADEDRAPGPEGVEGPGGAPTPGGDPRR